MSSDDFPRLSRIVQAVGGFAGNASASYGVPDPGAWYIAAVTFRVVTDGTVQTRTPLLSILGGDAVAIAVAAAGFGATATTTTDFSFAAGLGEWDQANNASASGPAPVVPLDAGDSITLSLANGVVGDAVSRIRITLAPLAAQR